MAESDVKLLDGQVKVEAWDLCLDSADRRKNDTPHRRALVHDEGDRLTLNWGGDYPKGVKIQGNTEIDGNLTVNGCLAGELKVAFLKAGWFGTGIVLEAKDLILLNRPVDEHEPGGAAIKTLSHVEGDKLVVNQGGGYKGGVEIEGKLRIQDSNQNSNDYKYVTIEGGSIISHHFYMGNIPGESAHSGHRVKRITSLDLVKELMEMKNEIKELKEKIKTLGG